MLVSNTVSEMTIRKEKLREFEHQEKYDFKKIWYLTDTVFCEILDLMSIMLFTRVSKSETFNIYSRQASTVCREILSRFTFYREIQFLLTQPLWGNPPTRVAIRGLRRHTYDECQNLGEEVEKGWSLTETVSLNMSSTKTRVRNGQPLVNCIRHI